MTKQRYPDEAYLYTPFFEGDRDVCIRAYKTKLVITRYEHPCAYSGLSGKMHQIKPGTRALVESCICEGQWGSSWSCLPCLDEWLDEIEWGGNGR